MASGSSALCSRQGVLKNLKEAPELSVLIIGGGVNGAGLFRDLALQGVDVLLVDKSDFCAGASAGSSRMIHGGLRYLEFGEFKLVKESLRDRNGLLLNAAHYVKPLPTTIPLFSRFAGATSALGKFLRISGERPASRGAVMVKMGLMFYDWFTRKNRLMPPHSFAGKSKALARRPDLPADVICTATYYDAWISYPERLCVELLMDGETACEKARAVNYVSIAKAEGDTVSLKDELSGELIDIKPRLVVNATGGWVDFTNRSLGRETQMIGGTKGAHLVLDNDALVKALDNEMIYYENSDGRVAIAFTWLGKALIGSTDIRIDNPDDVRCTEEEIDYIIKSIARVFPNIKVDRSQILSVFTGVRPLQYGDKTATVQVSRDHACPVVAADEKIHFPIYSMTGGKWTTFREFAEQVADKLLDELGKTRSCTTESLAIGGGRDFPKTDQARSQWIQRVHRLTGVKEERIGVTLDRYGTRAEQLAVFCSQQADQPLKHHTGYTRREIEFLVTTEDPTHLDDLVLRRTAMALLGELTTDLLLELATLMAPTCGWAHEDVYNEVDRCRGLLADRFRITLPRPTRRMPDAPPPAPKRVGAPEDEQLSCLQPISGDYNG